MRIRSVAEDGWTRHAGQLSEADSVSLHKNDAFIETSVQQYNCPSDNVVVITST